MFKSVSLGGVLVTALPERGHRCPQLGCETLKVRNTDVGYVNPTKGVFFRNPDGFLQGIYTILQKIHRRFQVIHGYSQPSNLHPVNIHREIHLPPDPWFQAERCASKKLQPLPTLNMDLVESVPWQNVGLIYLELKWDPSFCLEKLEKALFWKVDLQK